MAAVYSALLKHYSAENIGIYGCSAGGVLTAEATAWIISKKLPVPGAIGTFCGSVAEFNGDSTYVAPILNGQAIPSTPLRLASLPYFAGAKADDPLVFPANSPALLAKFPPTLLITGTRDFAMAPKCRASVCLVRRAATPATRVGRHVARALLRSGDARIEGGVCGDGELFRSPSRPLEPVQYLRAAHAGSCLRAGQERTREWTSLHDRVMTPEYGQTDPALRVAMPWPPCDSASYVEILNRLLADGVTDCR